MTMNDRNARLSKTNVATTPETFEAVARDMQRILKQSNDVLQENNAMLAALMKHLGVPYEKPPRGIGRD